MRKSISVAALILLLTGLVMFDPVAAQEPYDILIRNGRVLDGTGNPWYYADVGIRGERIVAVGDLDGARAGEVIDASGLYVTPGFIDAHSHHARGLAEEELSGGELLLTQGVSTIVANPDGGGPLDIGEQRRELERFGPALNVAPLIGHTTVRQAVLGLENRSPTAAELDRMRAHVRRGMEDGAFGLSTGLFYPPASYATTGEVIELARVASEYGGVHQSHLRDESDFTVGLVAAVDELIRISEEAQLPGIITHIKCLGPAVWGFSTGIIERVERARARGLEIFADQYPYLASGPSLEGALVPGWAQEGGREALLARIRDPEPRARVRSAMQNRIESRGGPSTLLIRVFPSDPSIVGRTLAELAQERDGEPVDVALDLLATGGAFFASFNQNPADKERFMRQPWTMTGSDGELVPTTEDPHPRSYANVQHKIRKYVVEEEAIDLAFAVRTMTALPAAVFSLEDRGLLREGSVADVVVFDLERMRDHATFEDPHQLSEGVVHLLVNGELAIDEERVTGTRAGRVLSLRGRGASPTSSN